MNYNKQTQGNGGLLLSTNVIKEASEEAINKQRNKKKNGPEREQSR